jgi:hypothetical protein
LVGEGEEGVYDYEDDDDDMMLSASQQDKKPSQRMKNYEKLNKKGPLQSNNDDEFDVDAWLEDSELHSISSFQKKPTKKDNQKSKLNPQKGRKSELRNENPEESFDDENEYSLDDFEHNSPNRNEKVEKPAVLSKPLSEEELNRRKSLDMIMNRWKLNDQNAQSNLVSDVHTEEPLQSEMKQNIDRDDDNVHDEDPIPSQKPVEDESTEKYSPEKSEVEDYDNYDNDFHSDASDHMSNHSDADRPHLVHAISPDPSNDPEANNVPNPFSYSDPISNAIQLQPSIHQTQEMDNDSFNPIDYKISKRSDDVSSELYGLIRSISSMSKTNPHSRCFEGLAFKS